ncbi:MAG: hypothetical protein ACREN2_03265 [Candidatus Dormibacteria bacterium]
METIDVAVPGDLEVPRVSRRALRALMPPEVRRAFPALYWSEEQLWALATPASDLDVRKLSWLIDLPVWRWRGKRFQVSIRDMLERPDEYAAHVAKAMSADLGFPIHVMRHRGRLVILDGYHRLLKTLLLGRGSISAVAVRRDQLEAGVA